MEVAYQRLVKLEALPQEGTYAQQRLPDQELETG